MHPHKAIIGDLTMLLEAFIMIAFGLVSIYQTDIQEAYRHYKRSKEA